MTPATTIIRIDFAAAIVSQYRTYGSHAEYKMSPFDG
jgi:hypothetical protein